jgi:hypothetical protein
MVWDMQLPHAAVAVAEHRHKCLVMNKRQGHGTTSGTAWCLCCACVSLYPCAVYVFVLFSMHPRAILAAVPIAVLF